MTNEVAQRIALCKKEKSTVLDLSELGLSSIPEEVGELVWLEKLDLDNNQIQILQGLDKLAQLSELSLQNNQIQTIQGLDKLAQLSRLSLSNNQIQTIQGLDKLTKLFSLSLSNNQIQTIQGLDKLIKLFLLNLDNNQIQTIQGLDKLAQLFFLSLSNNQIQAIQGLDNLAQLSALSLQNNQIQILQGLDKLAQLSTLSLSNNQIQILQGLDKLAQLSVLYLENNQIQILQGLDKLAQLSTLSLQNNQIQILQGLDKLAQLSALSLSNNQIQTIQGLDKLQQLQLLNLSENPITNLHFTQDIPTLAPLALYWETPKREADFDYTFEEGKMKIIVKTPGIYLYHCHQLVEPSPAWVQLGKAAVEDYFQALQEQGKKTLREAKLMLVGRPNIGKTTLSGKLRDIHSPLPPTIASTKGIEVEAWEYEQAGANYTIKIWDFGGQDIQYSLHQFFMTERAVYGLLDSTREYHDQAAGGDLYANYWLQTIDKMAKGSPTFHIYNHHKGQQINTSMHSSLCAQYDFMDPKPFVVDLAHVDQEEAEQKNLETLQAHIKKAVAALPNVGLVLPKKWAAVRQALLDKAQTTPIITLAAYQELCQQPAINIQDKKVMLLISSYLNEIGSIIHYNEDNTSPLYRLLILQRNWATEAVYKVALSPLVNGQGGLFQRKDLEQIWQADKDLSEEQAASYQEHLPELLELLQKFEICYPYGENQFLVPQQVTPNCPNPLPIPVEQALQLEYQYEFMPYGLVYRMAVRLHKHIKEKQIWKKGMILTHEEQGEKGWIVLEEARKQQQGSIFLSIYGNKTARYFLQKKIEEELKDLHRIYNMEDLVTLLVPCTCVTCEQATQPYQFNYHKQLLSKLKSGRGRNIECQHKDSWREVEILTLIDHAFLERPPEVKHILEKQQREKGFFDKEGTTIVHGDFIQAETMQMSKQENSHNTASNSHNTAPNQGAIQIGDHNTADNSTTATSPPIVEKKKAWYQTWAIWVGLSALLAGGVTWWVVVNFLPAYTAYAGWIALLGAALAGGLVYRLNPKFIYKNYAWLFFGTAVAKAGFSLGYNLIYRPSEKLFLQLESTEDWVDLCLVVVFLGAGGFCLWLHAQQKE